MNLGGDNKFYSPLKSFMQFYIQYMVELLKEPLHTFSRSVIFFQVVKSTWTMVVIEKVRGLSLWEKGSIFKLLYIFSVIIKVKIKLKLSKTMLLLALTCPCRLETD